MDISIILFFCAKVYVIINLEGCVKMTAHIESSKEDIADIVLLPGDPLRAKYIAEKFLTDAKLINKVRNIFGYTGYYKNRRVTVFSSGMGIPSVGIYAYELYKFYDVKKIIRIGTCGTMHPDVKLLDVVLGTSAYSLNTFTLLFDGDTEKEYKSTPALNELIINKGKELGTSLKCGKIITTDVFDPYVDQEKFMSNFPKDDYMASEMEAFGLYYLAQKLGREATCLLTVVDSKYDKRGLTSEERERSLDDMITLALEAVYNEN